MINDEIKTKGLSIKKPNVFKEPGCVCSQFGHANKRAVHVQNSTFVGFGVELSGVSVAPCQNMSCSLC